MNKTFKVIWNHSTQTWTAVSELAGTRKKSKSIKLTAISAALLMACSTAQAATHTAADDLVAINNAAATVPANEKPQAPGDNAIAAGRKAKAETANSVAIGPSAEVLKQDPTNYNSMVLPSVRKRVSSQKLTAMPKQAFSTIRLQSVRVRLQRQVMPL